MNHARRQRLAALLTAFVLAGAPPAAHAATDAGPTPLGPQVQRPAPRFVPDGAFAAFLAGRLAGSQGDLDYAADEFLRALAVDPDNELLIQQSFLACLMTKRQEAARLAARLRSNPAADLLLIDLDAQAGKWDAALAQARALPPQGPAVVLQPLLTAWLQLGAGRPDAALATLRPLTAETDRLRAVYALHAALIADLAGRPGDAARLYRIALSDPSAMNLRLAQIVANWQSRIGQPAEAERILSALTAGGDELAMAEPALLAAVGTRPVATPVDGIAEAYLALAATLRQQNANDFAMVLLRLAVDLRPDLTPARLLMAEIADGGKHPQAALNLLAPVGATDPLAGIVQLRRAALTERAGNADVAMAMLERLAKDHPNRPEPEAMLGDLLRSKGRFADAVGAYDQSIARLPAPQPADWPLFYARAIALERSHQWSRAETDFEQALKLAPEQPYVLNYLGYSWADQGQKLGQAQQLIERAMALKPNDGAIIDSLGWVMLRQGDVGQAVTNLERASELQPEDPTINAHLGDAYWAAGRKLEARYQWRRALTLNPEPEDVAKLEAKLHDATPAGGGPGSMEHSVE